MMRGNRKLACAACITWTLVLFPHPMSGQSSADESYPEPPAIASLQLAPQTAEQLQKAVSSRDYITAEKLLLSEIERDAHSPRAARLLAFAGTVYFRNQDYLNAAIAWKKSEAIAPLDPNIRFLLAMDYIRTAHPDWARPVLESLAAQNEKEALYPYWLGRLDYDGHQYNNAIRHFQHAIELNPEVLVIRTIDRRDRLSRSRVSELREVGLKRIDVEIGSFRRIESVPAMRLNLCSWTQSGHAALAELRHLVAVRRVEGEGRAVLPAPQRRHLPSTQQHRLKCHRSSASAYSPQTAGRRRSRLGL